METEHIQKRHVAVLIPYQEDQGGLRVFLQDRIKDNRRVFRFWGGGIEAGESPEQALRREIREELGIEVSGYSYFNHYEMYKSILDVYLLKVDEGFESTVKIGEGEGGRFFGEQEVIDAPDIFPNDKLILGNIFGKILRDDPYSAPE